MTTFPFDRRKPIILDPAAHLPLPGCPAPEPTGSAVILFDPDERDSKRRDADQRDANPFDPLQSGSRQCGPPGLIVFSHALPLLAMPTQPVGDPVPRPSTPQPTPQREPEDPVQAPHPREPELPAIDPHEPGLPDTRIGLYDGPSIGDPPRSSRTQWLV